MALGLAACTASANGLRVLSQDGFAPPAARRSRHGGQRLRDLLTIPPHHADFRHRNCAPGLYNIYLEPTFRQPPGPANTGQTYDINKHFAAVPPIVRTHTFKDSPVSIGLGIYAPFGGPSRGRTTPASVPSPRRAA